MSIFEYRDYKSFFKDWLQRQPKQGRGVMSQLAAHLGMNPAMMSHVFAGDKDLSLEAANDAAEFLGLGHDETNYWLLLVNYARAGSASLSERLGGQVMAEQKRNNELKNRLKPDRELSDVARAKYYSNWIYSGVRNMSACPQYKNTDEIARHLHVSRATVQAVIAFLLEHGLCLQENGELKPAGQITHLGNETGLAIKHHHNWRIRGMNQMTEVNDKNLFFTSPMSLSKETADLIRQKIPSFIEEIRKLVGPSPSEVVRCLNLDWFDY